MEVRDDAQEPRHRRGARPEPSEPASYEREPACLGSLLSRHRTREPHLTNGSPGVCGDVQEGLRERWRRPLEPLDQPLISPATVQLSESCVGPSGVPPQEHRLVRSVFEARPVGERYTTVRRLHRIGRSHARNDERQADCLEHEAATRAHLRSVALESGGTVGDDCSLHAGMTSETESEALAPHRVQIAGSDAGPRRPLRVAMSRRGAYESGDFPKSRDPYRRRGWSLGLRTMAERERSRPPRFPMEAFRAVPRTQVSVPRREIATPRPFGFVAIRSGTLDSGELDPPRDSTRPPLCGPGCSRAGRDRRVVPTLLRAVAAVAAGAGGPEPAERRGHLPRRPVIAFGGYCTTAPATHTGTETQLGAGPLVVPAKALLGGGATCPSSGHGAGGAAAGGGGGAARQTGSLDRHGVSWKLVLPGGQGGGCPQKDGRGVVAGGARPEGGPGSRRADTVPTRATAAAPPTILTTETQPKPGGG